MVEPGDVLEGIVLEAKEKTAVIKFGPRAIQARVLADLETGQKVKVKVQGWHKGKVVLRVLNKGDEVSSNSIDIKV